MLCFIFYFIFCTVHWADLSWPTFHYWLYPVWLCMWQINKNLEPWTLRTQDGDLQSGTDRQGPWRSWELRKPWRCRELRRPWWSWELRRPWRSWELWRPWRCRELWRPWQMVFGGLGLGPLGPAPTAGTLTTPPKISLGKWGGIRSPPGLNRQDSTKQDRNALQGQTDRTGQPTGTRSPPGLAWKLRLPLGMTWHQGPSQGPSATASTSATGGQAARMASMATTRGAACPRRVSMDKTDMMIKIFLWAQQNRHTALLAVTCGLSTGLGIAAASGHESAPIRWAWVSGDPAGMSQRRSGGLWVSGDPAGIESEAGRRALNQRRAGGVISRERRAWGSGNPGTRQPAGGLGRATAGGGYLPRSAGMRARGQWTRGTRGDPAELPRRLDAGYERDDERRLPCRGTDRHRNK